MMKQPLHPGRILKTCIDDLQLSVTDTAKVLHVARPNLSNIVNGKAGVSPEMALRIAKAFGSTLEMWLKMQIAYDLAQAQATSDHIDIVRYEPTPADRIPIPPL